MKNTFKTNKIASLFLALFLFAGCSEWLDNPLKDKETGEDINLLILDFNFFTTRMTYKLVDASDNSAITSPATIKFSGANGNDIVNFAGEKKNNYVTSEGQLELTVDPNISISQSNPLEFAINIDVPGYNSFTKGFQIRSEGPHTIELKLSKTTNEDNTDLEGDIDITDGDTSIVFFVPKYHNLKSAREVEKPYKINYKITLADLAKFKDTSGNKIFEDNDEAFNFLKQDGNAVVISVKTFAGYSPEVDIINNEGNLVSVLFHKLETGKLDRIQIYSNENTREVGNLNGGVISSTATYLDDVAPDIFGFGLFNEGSWNVLGTETVYDSLNFKYTLIKASLEDLCETGSSITFSSNVISSFSITGDVYDAATNNLITTINFKGNFPKTFQVENVPQKAVKIVFRNNNPSFAPIPQLEIENFCIGNYNVEVSAANGYNEYQIVLRAICPDNPTVAVAPTYSGQVRIKNSDDVWQEIDMAGGVVNLLGLPNSEYSLRLLWENAWEYSTYYTEFDANGNYIHNHGPKTKVESQKLEDGRMRIIVEQIFEQDVCNDMGW